MRYFLALSVLLAYSFSNAQIIVSDENINNIENIEYIEVLCRTRMLSSAVSVRIDYGQNVLAEFGKIQVIKDKDGEIITFTSRMQVLNFFDNNGWDLVSDDTLSDARNSWRVFLLRKENDNAINSNTSKPTN